MHLLETPDVNLSSVKLPNDVKNKMKLQRNSDAFIADLMKILGSLGSNFQSAEPPRWIKQMNTPSLGRAAVKLSTGCSDYSLLQSAPSWEKHSWDH